MARGDLIELDITDIVYGGNAFGRHEGKAVFVPYALPGERVEARIVEERKRFAVAQVERVLTASPERVEPPCPYFGPGKCGGCQWQHMDYAAQLATKEKIVRDQLTRFGGIADAQIAPTLPSPEPWAYRSHATMQTTGDGRLGYIATDRKTLIPIETCLIVRPELDALLGDLPAEDLEGVRRVRLQVGNVTDDVLLIATEADDPQDAETTPPEPDVRPDEDETPLPPADLNVRYNVHYREFQVTGGSFFQVNVPQAAALVEIVLRRLDLKGDERVLDLYAGVGLFTAFLAAEVRQVTAIESSPTAARDAQVNLAAFGNVLYIGDTVEEALPKVSGTFDAAVVDPPRSGLGAKVIALLLGIAPKKLVYVSCDPASLARDAKALIEGGYTFVDAQPVDMFPQTHHVETIATFVRA
jgi:23S rRNA (uracil1939-C5)-methyltransferase